MVATTAFAGGVDHRDRAGVVVGHVDPAAVGQHVQRERPDADGDPRGELRGRRVEHADLVHRAVVGVDAHVRPRAVRGEGDELRSAVGHRDPAGDHVAGGVEDRQRAGGPAGDVGVGAVRCELHVAGRRADGDGGRDGRHGRAGRDRERRRHLGRRRARQQRERQDDPGGGHDEHREQGGDPAQAPLRRLGGHGSGGRRRVVGRRDPGLRCGGRGPDRQGLGEQRRGFPRPRRVRSEPEARGVEEAARLDGNRRRGDGRGPAGGAVSFSAVSSGSVSSGAASSGGASSAGASPGGVSRAADDRSRSWAGTTTGGSSRSSSGSSPGPAAVSPECSSIRICPSSRITLHHSGIPRGGTGEVAATGGPRVTAVGARPVPGAATVTAR